MWWPLVLPGRWGLAQQAFAEGRLGKELVRATEHAVLMAVLAGALQGLYGGTHRL